MAEREGFEPPIPFQVWPLSRRLVSTTHAPLRSFENRQRGCSWGDSSALAARGSPSGMARRAIQLSAPRITLFEGSEFVCIRLRLLQSASPPVLGSALIAKLLSEPTWLTGSELKLLQPYTSSVFVSFGRCCKYRLKM